MKKSPTHASAWPRHLFLIGTSEPMPKAGKASKDSLESMGSKAWHLLRMARLGLPVPPALVLGTHYTREPAESLLPLFGGGLTAFEAVCGLQLGDAHAPLIVSVRSGAPVSMPGMMETLLNVGLCDATLPGLLRQSGNPRMVWDAYRRLIASYAVVVGGLAAQPFEAERLLACAGADERTLDYAQLRTLCRRYLELYQSLAGQPFPQDPREQLAAAVQAVYGSWFSPKADSYRKLHGIDEGLGTAVIVQRMVFGNTGHRSGAGVGFTRDPSSGEPTLWVDFLANAQGEDVVSGQRNAHGHATLAQTLPQAWEALQQVARTLEHELGDMQDFEFTVQDGHLYLLQTRSGKRTPRAAARIALDLYEAGQIERQTARERTAHLKAKDLVRQQLAPSAGDSAADAAAPLELARASSACSGIASGEIALDPERAIERTRAGVPVILVRQDAQTEDIEALQRVQGLLTQRGARTAHAAVVARQLGKVCLVGCEGLRIDAQRQTVAFGPHEFAVGQTLTLDGNQGIVYAGALAVVDVPDTPLQRRLQALRSNA
ncbi:MAG: pyruvate phosphate dikinase [Comamonadaceae bacterium BICA1-1]|nr:MAG: pyruvate phosphate dikinase [Comamonadaceae bacterium BICA1-1]